MEWNDDMIGRLRGLWDEGHSTAEIGRRLGASKNAVVGKAHRLGLPARPSPIRKDPSGRRRPPPPRRVVGPTLPPLSASLVTVPPFPSAVAMPAPVTFPRAASPAPSAAAQPRGPTSSPTLAPILAPALAPGLAPGLALAPRAAGRVHVCCWPLGEPGTRSFRFCDAEALPGKPYCDEHAQLAYVRVRDRREEAA